MKERSAFLTHINCAKDKNKMVKVTTGHLHSDFQAISTQDGRSHGNCYEGVITAQEYLIGTLTLGYRE